MQHPNLGKLTLFPPSSRWAIGLGIATLVSTGAGVAYLTHTQSKPLPIMPAAIAQPTQINALGRLEPQGTVLNISEPSGQGGAYRVDQLLVQVGDSVKADQIIAILDNRNRLEGSLREAQEQVKVAQANLNRVKAGAQQGEIAAQRATIARLEAQLVGEVSAQKAAIARLEAEMDNAQVEYQRNLELYQNGVISASALDSKSLAVKTAEQQVNEARANLDQAIQTLQRQVQEGRATLDRIIEVRPTDIAAAQADVDRAMAFVSKTQAELEAAYVRAPQAGRILRIHTHAGEAVNPAGIVELGQTNQMYAVAEIYEGDIAKVRKGQVVKITADTFPETLNGTVEQIGWTIAKQDILNTDPTAATDARVVEVKIRLDQAASQRVAQLTNLQVNVEIAL